MQRAKDPIQGKPPQITTTHKQKRTNKVTIGIRKLKLSFREKINI